MKLKSAITQAISIEGAIEYQIGITDRNITDFDVCRVEASEIGNKVLEKGRSD